MPEHLLQVRLPPPPFSGLDFGLHSVCRSFRCDKCHGGLLPPLAGRQDRTVHNRAEHITAILQID